MATKSSLLCLLAFSGNVLCDTHYLFSGFFSGDNIVALEFDDTASTLSVINNITTDASEGSKWIALDGSNENLYVATTGYIQSYSITSDLDLQYQSNISLSSNCTNANFIVASTAEPFTVFGAPYSTGCSSLAISVDSGVLDTSFASLEYDSTAGVHGLALSPASDFVYSADDMGNAVWVHSYDNSSGAVEEVQRLSAPTGANPRHLAVHPNGLFVFVVYEELSEIAVYSRDIASGELISTNTTYSLIPPTFTNTSSYWADEVLLSVPNTNGNAKSPKYLICGTRSHETSAPGYVAVFSLDSVTGNIVDQLFILPTTSSGGSANAVSPSKFSEDYFAITDSASNFVEVWKIETGAANSTASTVAHLDLDTGPANVVWLN
ncbi:hypothetical protein G7Z17_g5049 [Cylindrodendrum hubeiense]|uniref:Carboxy-cis,cis-muconate cyclase n=1 Tax=Cylindrodendrum hubeiense TaxID=595255 RepID=A0A9P5HDP9_9HYPO|nr:hypothetical protein G7Z17_g5049 [Cylindrodendrum hubeiense]